MDLNSLKDTVSNLTLYDLKAGVRKVQNGELILPRLSIASCDADTVPCSRHELHRNGGEGKNGIRSRAGTLGLGLTGIARSGKLQTTSHGEHRQH
jgi:hypothetical protein